MCGVGGVRRQHDLGIRGQLDLARPAAAIGNRHATDLGIVLGRDRHLQCGGERAVAPDDLDPILEERGFIAIRFDCPWVGTPPTTPRRCPHREGRCRCPSRRASRPRASA